MLSSPEDSMMKMFVPKELFLTKGVGRHKEKLASFEAALRNADIAEYNLVRVSSIFPPKCRIIPKEKGIKKLYHGQILFVVLADIGTNEPNRLIASSVGVAVPSDKNTFGYLSEYHGYGVKEQVAGDYAEDLAAQMLASTLGISYDEKVHYDARKDLWKINKETFQTRNITQTATGHKDGLWTTVISAAVLIF
jgi:arginine decarboxylase